MSVYLSDTGIERRRLNRIPYGETSVEIGAARRRLAWPLLDVCIVVVYCYYHSIIIVIIIIIVVVVVVVVV